MIGAGEYMDDGMGFYSTGRADVTVNYSHLFTIGMEGATKE